MSGHLGRVFLELQSFRGQFSMIFDHYAPCPRNVAEEVIKEVKEREAAK